MYNGGMRTRLSSNLRMEKTPRYTQRERNMVLGFAAQYKDVIENKRTDAESNRKKDEVWRIIAKEFNTRVYHQRTSKQLRQLYKNMKLLLKKDLSVEGRTRSFMDILNNLSQQQSQPAAYNNSYQPIFKTDYEDEQKGSSSFHSEQPESDMVVVKSEEFSDNEQSFNNDDCDDSISNKDIPEVCLDEVDDDDFDAGGGGGGGGLVPNPITHENVKNDGRSESLISLAIEERKRKIDLINAQIEYWRALTKKLESTSSAYCPCHMPRMNGINQS